MLNNNNKRKTNNFLISFTKNEKRKQNQFLHNFMCFSRIPNDFLRLLTSFFSSHIIFISFHFYIISILTYIQFVLGKEYIRFNKIPE